MEVVWGLVYGLGFPKPRVYQPGDPPRNQDNAIWGSILGSLYLMGRAMCQGLRVCGIPGVANVPMVMFWSPRPGFRDEGFPKIRCSTTGQLSGQYPLYECLHICHASVGALILPSCRT